MLLRSSISSDGQIEAEHAAKTTSNKRVEDTQLVKLMENSKRKKAKI